MKIFRKVKIKSTIYFPIFSKERMRLNREFYSDWSNFGMKQDWLHYGDDFLIKELFSNVK